MTLHVFVVYVFAQTGKRRAVRFFLLTATNFRPLLFFTLLHANQIVLGISNPLRAGLLRPRPFLEYPQRHERFELHVLGSRAPGPVPLKFWAVLKLILIAPRNSVAGKSRFRYTT